MFCRNCGEEIYTPDDRTGLIHSNGKYGCETEKGKWLGEVAEEDGDNLREEYESGFNTDDLDSLLREAGLLP